MCFFISQKPVASLSCCEEACEPSMAKQIVLEELAAVLDIAQDCIDQGASFTSHGGLSITSLQFSAQCKRRGVFVAIDQVLSSPTIRQLLDSCHVLDQSTAVTSGPGTFTSPKSSYVEARSGYYMDHVSRNTSHDFAQDSPDTASLVSTSPEPFVEVGENFPPSTHGSVDSYTKPRAYHRSTVKNALRISYVESEDICDPHYVPEETAELTEIQISLIHGTIKTPGTNIIHYYETYLPNQIPRMKHAWKQVLQNEPIFRTRYLSPEDGCLLLPSIHWREFNTTSFQSYKDALSPDQAGLPAWPEVPAGFDLGIRFSVVNFRDEMNGHNFSTIIWSVHHALIDGYSATMVLQKVRQAASGLPVQPGPSFLDLASALEGLRVSRKAEGDAFWERQKESLAASRDELLLPRPGLAGKKIQKEEVRVNLGHHWSVLKMTARSCGVTPATILHAAWAITLALYTDADSVVFGAVMSGRNLLLPGALDAVGPLLNTLPLQVDIVWESSVRIFLRDVFARMQDLARLSWTTPENGFSRTFGSVLAMQLEVQVDETDSVKQIGKSFSSQTTNIPLSVIIRDDGQTLMQYSNDFYACEHMQAVVKCFRDSVVALTQPEMSIETCVAGLLSTSSIATLRKFGNCESGRTTRSSIAHDLVTLFEAAATKQPYSVAIQQADRKVTYADLERLSGRMACKLACIISPEEVVAVHADGSINWIISVYAVLRAGGTYCPIDKAHPQELRDSLFEASTGRYFLATSKEALAVKPKTAVSAIDVESIVEAELEAEAQLHLRNQPRPWERAYLCFTSGSTGKPKGVMCSHESVVAFQKDLEVRLFAGPGQRIAQFMSVAFDGSIHELFSCFSYGATLVLRSEGDPFDHLKLADSAVLTPSVASLLNPADFPTLKTVYLVGEAVPQAVCDTWSSCKTLLNMYGPTEATCGATIKRLLPGRPVTIGRPNPSTRVYILNHRRQLAPIGRVGEIYLAGVQVARGYIGRPELTGERFLPDTICRGLGEYMYKTGDRGHWNEVGEIVFLGRADRQIKLRGFRLDLEDLEMRILGSCDEARAVAITRRHDDLVCMIQTAFTNVSHMRAEIVKAVPAFAVPRHILLVAKFPVTPTGKIDYRAIAEAVKNPFGGGDTLETDTEAVIATSWGRVLNIDPRDADIKPSSNFAALGGHSLHQLRLASTLTADFGVQVTLRMITELPTLRDLGKAIDSMTRGQSKGWNRRERALGRYEPSPIEKDWWHKYVLDRSSSAFNVSYVSRFDPKLIDRQKLIDAWNVVLARHEIFRSRYIHHRKHGLERLLASHPPSVQKLSSINVWLELNTPFKLENTPPVRVAVTKDTVVATWSHIICDYTTLGLVLAEVAAVYRDEPLDPVVQMYRQTTIWNATVPPCYLSFWHEYLRGVTQTRPAYLGNGSDRSTYRGTSSIAKISTPLWRRMLAYTAKIRITLQQLALGATALALTSNDDDMDITLGIPFINRQSEADMQTVGLFLEPLPVRIAFASAAESRLAFNSNAANTCSSDRGENDSVPVPSSLEGTSSIAHQLSPATPAAYVAAVQASAQRALSHAIPWHQLLDHLKITAAEQFPNHPLFDCVVSFHDHRHDVAASSAEATEGGAWSKLALGSGMQPQLVWSEGAKFKLMVEFMGVSEDTLLLRLEYDTRCFGSREHIAAVRRMVLRAVEAVVTGDASGRELSFEGLRKELKTAWRAEEAAAFGTESCREVEARLLDGAEGFFQRSLAEL